jgi:hypothetical protein
MPCIAPLQIFRQKLTVSLTPKPQESLHGTCLKEQKFTPHFRFFLQSNAYISEKVTIRHDFQASTDAIISLKA